MGLLPVRIDPTSLIGYPRLLHVDEVGGGMEIANPIYDAVFKFLMEHKLTIDPNNPLVVSPEFTSHVVDLTLSRMLDGSVISPSESICRRLSVLDAQDKWQKK
jgi:hypothetical protein